MTVEKRKVKGRMTSSLVLLRMVVPVSQNQALERGELRTQRNLSGYLPLSTQGMAMLDRHLSEMVPLQNFCNKTTESNETTLRNMTNLMFHTGFMMFQARISGDECGEADPEQLWQ